MKLIDMTLTDFIEEVDSTSPAPGGGSVAAPLSFGYYNIIKKNMH